MYSIYQRGSALCTFVFNFTIVLLAIIFALSYTIKRELPASNLTITHNSFTNRNRNNIEFLPNIDLSSQFNLNVKQIFLYLKVNYDDQNSDMVWSSIVKRDNKKSFMKKCYRGYELPPITAKKVVFELRGCVFPYIGMVNDVLYEKKSVGVF